MFGRKREDVPEIRVEGEEATIGTQPGAPEFDDAERAPHATESRRVKIPKTKWF